MNAVSEWLHRKDVADMVEVRASINGGPWQDAYARAGWTTGEEVDLLSLRGLGLRRERLAVTLDLEGVTTGPVEFAFVTPDGDKICGEGQASIQNPRPGLALRSLIEGDGYSTDNLIAEWQADTKTRLANAKVAAYILAKFRDGAHTDAEKYLAVCPDVTVTHVQGEDGSYGCDTGCGYVRLTARVSCPHYSVDYEYGEFGDLNMLLDEVFGRENVGPGL